MRSSFLDLSFSVCGVHCLLLPSVESLDCLRRFPQPGEPASRLHLSACYLRLLRSSLTLGGPAGRARRARRRRGAARAACAVTSLRWRRRQGCLFCSSRSRGNRSSGGGCGCGGGCRRCPQASGACECGGAKGSADGPRLGAGGPDSGRRRRAA